MSIDMFPDAAVEHIAQAERQRVADANALDQIASVLADPEWSAGHIEWVADLLSTARPHPGGYQTRREYADVFEAATGRELPGDNDDNEDDDSIGGPRA